MFEIARPSIFETIPFECQKSFGKYINFLLERKEVCRQFSYHQPSTLNLDFFK